MGNYLQAIRAPGMLPSIGRMCVFGPALAYVNRKTMILVGTTLSRLCKSPSFSKAIFCREFTTIAPPMVIKPLEMIFSSLAPYIKGLEERVIQIYCFSHMTPKMQGIHKTFWTMIHKGRRDEECNQIRDSLIQHINILQNRCNPYFCLGQAIFTPLLHEFIFRSVLQQKLLPYLAKKYKAHAAFNHPITRVLISSVCYSLAYVQFRHSSEIYRIFVKSLLLGGLAELTQDFTPGAVSLILGHFVEYIHPGNIHNCNTYINLANRTIGDMGLTLCNW